MKRYYFKNLRGHYVVRVSNSERHFDSIRRAKQFAKKYGEEVYTWDYWGAKRETQEVRRVERFDTY
jgi:hypothetical protein